MAKRLAQSVFLPGWLDFPCKQLSPIALYSQREDGKSASTETREDEGHVQDSNLWIALVEEPHWKLECFMDFLRQLSKRYNYFFFRVISALHSVPTQHSCLVENV